MHLEKAADALVPVGPGYIAAGQRLAGSQVELGEQTWAQIFTANLTSLFSHTALLPSSGTHENRCETIDSADWSAAYVRTAGVQGRRGAVGHPGQDTPLACLPPSAP
jgi:hypothetical protein